MTPPGIKCAANGVRFNKNPSYVIVIIKYYNFFKSLCTSTIRPERPASGRIKRGTRVSRLVAECRALNPKQTKSVNNLGDLDQPAGSGSAVGTPSSQAKPGGVLIRPRARSRPSAIRSRRASP